MKFMQIAPVILLSGIVVLGLPGLSPAGDRATRAMEKNDADGDDRISRDEWRKRPRAFKKIDTDKDGYLSIGELRARFGGPAEAAPEDGSPTLDGQTTRADLDEETLCGIARGRKCDIKLAIRRGLFETGLRPRFPDGLDCRGIDEQWAISYTHKRDRENYHGGIDMPAPFGTPIIAAAAGTVVGKYRGDDSYRGMEIILRHSPDDTGIPLWIYTQYAHFDELPKQEPGQRVRMGEVLGPTGNSGKSPSRRKFGRERRPAIHFAVWYSTSPKFVSLRRKIVPVDGWWMDPNALFRKKPPFDTQFIKALPEAEKRVPISVMLDDGRTIPADTKIVWPYTCTRD
jgi:hypothetical protein